jgi:hypothetical protein
MVIDYYILIKPVIPYFSDRLGLRARFGDSPLDYMKDRHEQFDSLRLGISLDFATKH